MSYVRKSCSKQNENCLVGTLQFSLDLITKLAVSRTLKERDSFMSFVTINGQITRCV